MSFPQLTKTLASLALTLWACELQAAELMDATYAKWRDYILPKSDELAWRKIPWRPSYWEAVVEAQANEKPILLWTMNGHPLCNT